MSEAPANPRVCPACRAIVGPADRRCWLCELPLTEFAGMTATGPAGPPPVGAAPHVSYSLATLLLIMTVLAISCALIAAAPGLGIMAAILLVPVLVRTSMVVARELAGDRVSPGEKIALGAASFVATTLLVTVVGFTAFCCFCSVCALIVGAGSTNTELLWLALGAGVLGVALFFLLRRLIRASRARYYRDIQTRNP